MSNMLKHYRLLFCIVIQVQASLGKLEEVWKGEQSLLRDWLQRQQLSSRTLNHKLGMRQMKMSLLIVLTTLLALSHRIHNPHPHIVGRSVTWNSTSQQQSEKLNHWWEAKIDFRGLNYCLKGHYKLFVISIIKNVRCLKASSSGMKSSVCLLMWLKGEKEFSGAPCALKLL